MSFLLKASKGLFVTSSRPSDNCSTLVTSLVSFSDDADELRFPEVAVVFEVLGRAPVSVDKRDVVEGVTTDVVALTDEVEVKDENVTEDVIDVEGDAAILVRAVDIEELSLEEAVDDVEDVVSPGSVGGTLVATLVAGMLVVAFLATTELYCCISMTAASRRT